MLFLAVTDTAQIADGSILNAIGPIITILTLLFAYWQRIRAAKIDKLFRITVVGVKAALSELDKEDAEMVKAKVEATAGGKNSPTNLALKAEVRKTDSNMIALREDGLPKLLPLLLLTLLIGGCVSPAIHDAAVKAQNSAAILRRASQAKPGYSEDDQADYRNLWRAHESAIAEIEEASK